MVTVGIIRKYEGRKHRPAVAFSGLVWTALLLSLTVLLIKPGGLCAATDSFHPSLVAVASARTLETKQFSTSDARLLNGATQNILAITAVFILFLAGLFFIFDREHKIHIVRDQAQYYQRLFAAIPEPALLTSKINGVLRIETVNSALCTLLARSEESLLGMPLNDIVHLDPDSKSTTLTELLERSNIESRWQLMAGQEVIPVEVKTSQIHGPVCRILIVARDLREQLKAEESVRRAYEQYHTLFDEAPDPVVILSDHIIIHANRAMETLLGCSAEDLTGKKVADLSPCEQPGKNLSTQMAISAEQHAMKGTTQHFDWVLSTKGGDGIICAASLRSIPSAGASILQEIFHDVTEQRRAQEHNLQLEKELLQAQKMEAVGRLAGGIAHDFNNIMGGIIGHASLLKADATEGTNLYEGLSTIENAGHRAAELTHRLLSFSRKERTTVANVDVGNVLSDTLAIAMPGFDKRIVLVKRIDPDLRHVAGDRTQLEEAFLNLVINARDALDHQPGTLTVDASNVIVDKSSHDAHDPPNLSDGSYIRICISDTGCGIPPEAREHLFEPFFTTRAEGTGMGLSIVWHVVHDHGGMIQVKSTVGKGTTFTLYFPAVLWDEKVESDVQIPVQKLLPHSRHNELILIVDDEDIVRTVAAKMLTRLGYRVMDTADPLEALALYSHSWSSISLVLIDMMMPRMNGKELLGHMRTLNPSLRAILMSGYNASDTPTADGGFAAFISKPYTLQELAEQVHQVLDESCTCSGAAAAETSRL